MDEIDALSVLLLHRARQVGILPPEERTPSPVPDRPSHDREPAAASDEAAPRPEEGDDEDALKRCAMCGNDLPRWMFGKTKQSKDGRFSYCRACNRAYHRTRNARIRQEQLEEKYKKEITGGFDFNP